LFIQRDKGQIGVYKITNLKDNDHFIEVAKQFHITAPKTLEGRHTGNSGPHKRLKVPHENPRRLLANFVE